MLAAGFDQRNHGLAGERNLVLAPTGRYVLMGIQVDLITTNFPSRIPGLRIARDTTPRRVRVNWEPRGWRLQSSPTITGVWANVAGVTTNMMGHTNTLPTTGNRFYRLKRPDVP
jgi:hypothetical protein